MLIRSIAGFRVASVFCLYYYWHRKCVLAGTQAPRLSIFYGCQLLLQLKYCFCSSAGVIAKYFLKAVTKLETWL